MAGDRTISSTGKVPVVCFPLSPPMIMVYSGWHRGECKLQSHHLPSRGGQCLATLIFVVSIYGCLDLGGVSAGGFDLLMRVPG